MSLNKTTNDNIYKYNIINIIILQVLWIIWLDINIDLTIDTLNLYIKGIKYLKQIAILILWD